MAWAQFFRALAVAANQLAAELTEVSSDEGQDLPGEPSALPETFVVGKRQRAILAVPGLRDENGIKTADIARAIGNPDVPNVYLAMRALEKRGLVELIPRREPQHWRFVARFRDGSLPTRGDL